MDAEEFGLLQVGPGAVMERIGSFAPSVIVALARAPVEAHAVIGEAVGGLVALGAREFLVKAGVAVCPGCVGPGVERRLENVLLGHLPSGLYGAIRSDIRRISWRLKGTIG